MALSTASELCYKNSLLLLQAYTIPEDECSELKTEWEKIHIFINIMHSVLTQSMRLAISATAALTLKMTTEGC